MLSRKFCTLRLCLPLGLIMLLLLSLIFSHEIVAAFSTFKGVKTIGPKEFVELSHHQSAIIVDVREQEEYAVSHLPEAIWVKDLDLSSVPKDQAIIVYCTVGIRSSEWGATLIDQGFSEIYNLDGGIISWKNEGHTVLNSKNQPTDSVHVYSDWFGFMLKNGLAVD